MAKKIKKTKNKIVKKVKQKTKKNIHMKELDLYDILPHKKKFHRNTYRIEKVLDKDSNEFFIKYNSEKSRLRQLEILATTDNEIYSGANVDTIDDFISDGNPTEYEYKIMRKAYPDEDF